LRTALAIILGLGLAAAVGTISVPDKKGIAPMMRKLVAAAAISSATLAGFGIGAAYVNAQSGATEELPAYHADPPSAPLPAALDPKLFPDAQTQSVYALAAKEKDVLYQQPCYCRSDKHVGRKSLLDCYVDRHASVCDVCKKEAVYAYQQSKQGKTPRSNTRRDHPGKMEGRGPLAVRRTRYREMKASWPTRTCSRLATL
jgi:hypothetical protein